jgi:hypothetical protein
LLQAAVQKIELLFTMNEWGEFEKDNEWWLSDEGVLEAIQKNSPTVTSVYVPVIEGDTIMPRGKSIMPRGKLWAAAIVLNI